MDELESLRARCDFLEGQIHRRNTVIESLRAEVARLTAERDALRVDAERYRWLRDVGDATWRPFGSREGYSGQQADAAIDAARAAKGTT